MLRELERNLFLQYKLARIRAVGVAAKGIPYVTTHDGRTISYPDPLIKVNDTVMIDIANGKISNFAKFDTGRSIW